MEVTQSLNDKIKDIETSFSKTDERQILASFRELIPDKEKPVDGDLRTEIMAFDFMENYPKKETSWGTYFGPSAIWAQDGGLMESPSINKVTASDITYWTQRAYDSIHPLLKARYFGLVYDFSERITSIKPDIKIKTGYIESLLQIASSNLHNRPTNVIQKLKRAYNIAKSINNEVLIKASKDCMLKYESEVAEDHKPGLWGFSFDTLILNEGKVILEDSEKDMLILDLEDRLSRTSDNDAILDPWASEAGAVRLARYYRSKKKYDDVKRVLLKLEKSYKQIFDKGNGLQICSVLEKLHQLYTEFQLNTEAEQILIKLREYGSKVRDDMNPVSFEMSFTKEEIDNAVRPILTGESIEEILIKISIVFTPDKDDIEVEVRNLAKEFPMTSIFTHRLIDRKGRTIVKIGSVEDDLDGRILNQISKNLEYTRLLLHVVLSDLFEKESFNENKLLDEYIFPAGIFEDSKIELLRRGLRAYFEKDYAVCAHLIIPQIEDALRNTLELGGGVVLKPTKNSGTFQLRTFDDILRDPLLQEILGSDFTTYCQVLFTDQRGWNLRNGLCHGLLPYGSFSKSTCDRLIHVLLFLGRKIRLDK